MLDLNTIAEFSRANCGTICAFLVPANILATLQTLVFTARKSSPAKLRLMAGCASCYAVLMLLHVYSWFDIGIVMMPTYILLALGGLCLATNILAIAYSTRLSDFIEFLIATGSNWGERRRKKSYDLGL